MVCNCCKSEFENIHSLKFCPYCGTKIEESIDFENDKTRDYNNSEFYRENEKVRGKYKKQSGHDAEEQEMLSHKDGELEDNQEEQLEDENIKIYNKKVKQLSDTPVEETAKKNEKFDTLTMPVITDEQIKKYKRNKFFSAAAKPFKNLKIVISAATIIVLMALGTFGYMFFSARPVEEGRIKEDLIGKAIVLPKGTSFEIKKGYIKSFAVSERNTNKSEKKDDIKAAVTLNNGTFEVKTILAMQYAYEGNNKWKISDKVEIAGDSAVKPLIGMDENLILEEVKKASIAVGNTPKALNGEDVKTLAIASRTPDFDNFKEEVIIDASFDSGIVAASGKVKAVMNFADEVWSVTTVERASTDDFALVLSPTFSQDKITEAVKKDVLNTTVSHANVFGGKGFHVSDSFTKSITIGDKKFDAPSGSLIVSAKRQNTAGELKSVISSEYTFTVSFSKVELVKKSKPVVDSVAIDDMSKDFIVSSIANNEIDGNNIFLWYSSNHKITAEEAKSFKTEKILSKKGMDNVKYVYGSITYKDGSKQKTTALVATYFLVYDSSRGYNWKLDRIVGEDSPNYKQYVPEPR
jgi:hypothetical protein